MISRISIVAFVPLLAVTQGQSLEPNFPQDNDDLAGNLIPEWLPQCFNGVESFDPFGVVECVHGNTLPSCLVGTNLQDIVTDVAQCISSSIEDEVAALFDQQDGTNNDQMTATSRQGDTLLNDILHDFLGNLMGEEADGLLNVGQAFVNATLDCLDPFANCVEETIQQAMDNLNPCINTTLAELVQCGQDNSDACLESCNGTQLVDASTNPFGNLVLTQVDTCPQIQSNIMDPLCDIVGCCEVCVPKVEALMECLVNDQLDQVPSTGESCDMTCPSPDRRRRLGKEDKPHLPPRNLNAAPTSKVPSEECLQFAPGLTGGDSEELSARSAVFLPCAYDSFRKAMDEPQIVASTDSSEVPGTPETNEGTSTNSEGTSEVNEATSAGRPGSAFGNMAMAAAVSALAVLI